MPATSHPPFLSACSLPALSQPSTSQGFAPSVSVATGNSNLVTQECFDLPNQSHYSAGQIHWPRVLHNTLLVITCKYPPSLLHDIHNPNKSRENERTDAGKGTGAFKTHSSAWHPVQQRTQERRKSGEGNIYLFKNQKIQKWVWKWDEKRLKNDEDTNKQSYTNAKWIQQHIKMVVIFVTQRKKFAREVSCSCNHFAHSKTSSSSLILPANLNPIYVLLYLPHTLEP